MTNFVPQPLSELFKDVRKNTASAAERNRRGLVHHNLSEITQAHKDKLDTIGDPRRLFVYFMARHMPKVVFESIEKFVEDAEFDNAGNLKFSDYFSKAKTDAAKYAALLFDELRFSKSELRELFTCIKDLTEEDLKWIHGNKDLFPDDVTLFPAPKAKDLKKKAKKICEKFKDDEEEDLDETPDRDRARARTTVGNADAGNGAGGDSPARPPIISALKKAALAEAYFATFLAERGSEYLFTGRFIIDLTRVDPARYPAGFPKSDVIATLEELIIYLERSGCRLYYRSKNNEPLNEGPLSILQLNEDNHDNVRKFFFSHVFDKILSAQDHKALMDAVYNAAAFAHAEAGAVPVAKKLPGAYRAMIKDFAVGDEQGAERIAALVAAIPNVDALGLYVHAIGQAKNTYAEYKPTWAGDQQNTSQSNNSNKNIMFNALKERFGEFIGTLATGIHIVEGGALHKLRRLIVDCSNVGTFLPENRNHTIAQHLTDDMLWGGPVAEAFAKCVSGYLVAIEAHECHEARGERVRFEGVMATYLADANFARPAKLRELLKIGPLGELIYLMLVGAYLSPNYVVGGDNDVVKTLDAQFLEAAKLIGAIKSKSFVVDVLVNGDYYANASEKNARNIATQHGFGSQYTAPADEKVDRLPNLEKWNKEDYFSLNAGQASFSGNPKLLEKVSDHFVQCYHMRRSGVALKMDAAPARVSSVPAATKPKSKQESRASSSGKKSNEKLSGQRRQRDEDGDSGWHHPCPYHEFAKEDGRHAQHGGLHLESECKFAPKHIYMKWNGRKYKCEMEPTKRERGAKGLSTDEPSIDEEIQKIIGEFHKNKKNKKN